MQLAHDHGDALEHINRLETGDNSRHAVLLSKESVRLHADDGAHMARQDERIQLQLGVVNDDFQRIGHVLVDGKHAEVLESERLGAFDGHRRKRRGRLEAHSHEHDLAVGIRLRQRECIER